MQRQDLDAGWFHPALFVLVAFFLFISTYSGLSHSQVFKLPVITLTINKHSIQAELATTSATRNFGLMYRTSLPENQGMLFVFEYPQQPCFWMKNTFVPLSIAFIRQDGIISSLHDMHPESRQNHCPQEAILYALEMQQGWFEKQGIQANSRVVGLPPVSRVIKGR